ncbi:MAG: NF038122 family metalloprotease [Methanobacteriota archaeon]
MNKKILNIWNKASILAVVLLFVVSSCATAQTIKQIREKKTSTNYVIRGLGPVQDSVLYADGSHVQIQTEYEAHAILAPDFNPDDMSLEEFESIVTEAMRNTQYNQNEQNEPLRGERTGLDVTFSLSNPPGGAAAAAAAVEAYYESTFADPISVTIPVSWANLPDGVIGWTYTYYASSVSWTNTRNGLISDMDPDDTIQNWLPDGSTIPVRYSLGTTITNENICIFSRANYKAAIGTTSGIDGEIQFNTDFTFDYDPSNGISPGTFCFESILVHESGHALGFTSRADNPDNNIEALDIFRFQRSDGSYDYNPDTLAEFQTKPRFVVLDNGAYTDDVNSDLISAEYRMSDGNPAQASHFSTQISPAQLMEPYFDYGQTFYPNFFRNADIAMFDAIGWDYAAESGSTTFPFFDNIPSTTINRDLWTGLEGATANDIGIAEPSSPYSLDLDGSATGGDKIRTARIDTTELPEISFSYYYERTGGGDSPESGDDLVVEYYNDLHNWVEISRQLGSGADMTTYQYVNQQITAADAFHPDFRIQIRVISSQTGLDDWFVDDVRIDYVYYTLSTGIEGQGSIEKTPDQSSYASGSIVMVRAIPAQDWSFDHWEGALSGNWNPDNITMDSNKLVIANFTMNDILSPEWRSQGQSADVIPVGGSVILSAQGRDDRSLDYAYLSTNESGVWVDYSQGEWWDLNWKYHKPLRINHTLVAAQLTDFPILVDITAPEFIGHAQTDGDDFVFIDATNTTRYSHEVEYYNSATGHLVAWVKIPQLSVSDYTLINLYYGNLVCGNQETVEQTWTNGFTMVHHLTGATPTDLDDSTINNYDIITSGGGPLCNQVGIIGNCVDFDGTNDYLRADTFNYPSDSSYTVSAWARADGNPGTRKYISEGHSDASISLLIWTNETFKARTHVPSGYPVCYSQTSVNPSNPQWYYATTRLNVTNDLLEIMVNGVYEGGIVFTGAVNPATGIDIGVSNLNSYWMNGKIDEIRFANVVRSDAWVLTEYNMMAQPSLFILPEPEIPLGVAQHGSPMDLDTSPHVWVWTNFTWQNASIPAGRTIGWKITYVDTSSNIISTNVRSFLVTGGSGYTLTIHIDGQGSVLKDPDYALYPPDTPVELTAVPALGWHFDQWSGDLQGSDNPDIIIMDGNKVVTAHFVQDQYTLTINIDGSGTVTKVPDQGSYTYGTPVQLTAHPAVGWHFVEWTGDLVSTNNPDTIVMTHNSVVTAHFAQDQYTLTIEVQGQGTVTRDPDYPTYTYGTSVELTAHEAQGWQFDYWDGDLQGTQNPDTIIMDGDKSVTAFFIEIITGVVFDGDCTYDDMSPVNDVTVEIVNLNTGQKWVADTVDNHYTLTLEPGVDISAGQTIRYIARDTDNSVNVTDHPVTQGELDSGAIHQDLILRIHYRDLKSFPFYYSQVNSGAMVMKQMLDYCMWNNTLYSQPRDYYSEQTMYDNYSGGDVINVSELAGGLNAEINDHVNGWIYGYFFAPSGHDLAVDALKSAVIWLDYNISGSNEHRQVDVPKLGHPYHVPIAVPTGGNYDHWMVIRGIHTNRSMWDTSIPGDHELLNGPVTIYGFWVNDPNGAGLGDNTYVTYQYFNSTYFQRLNVPADDYYNNKFVVITDPPRDTVVDTTNLDLNMGTLVKFTTTQAKFMQTARRTPVLRDQADKLLVQKARTAIDLVVQNDAELGPLFNQAIVTKVTMQGATAFVTFKSDSTMFTASLNALTGELNQFTVDTVVNQTISE